MLWCTAMESNTRHEISEASCALTNIETWNNMCTDKKNDNKFMYEMYLYNQGHDYIIVGLNSNLSNEDLGIS